MKRYHPARMPSRDRMERRDKAHDIGGIWRRDINIDPLVMRILDIENEYLRPDLSYVDRPVLEKLRELRTDIIDEKISKKDYERYKEAAENKMLTTILKTENRTINYSNY